MTNGKFFKGFICDDIHFSNVNEELLDELIKIHTVEAGEEVGDKLRSCLMPVNTDTEEYFLEQIQYIKTQLKHTKKDYEKISLQKELGRLEKKLRVLKLRKEN